MPKRCRSMLFAAMLALPCVASAQSDVVKTEHVRAQLLAHAPKGIAPGAEVWLGLAIEHAPHWHTYWKNPGDSGLPTTLAWQLPAGVAAQDIAWPTPKALRVGPLTNYGYVDTLLLPVPLRVDPGFAAKTISMRLHAEWLVCEEICIPESGEFVLELPTGAPAVAHESAFATALALAPTEPKHVLGAAHVEGATLAVRAVGLPSNLHGQTLQFFPELGGVIDHAAPIEQQWSGETWQARVPLSAQRSESPPTLHAVLVAPGPPAGIRVSLPVAWPSAAAVAGVAPSAGNQAPPPPVSSFDLGTWLFPGLALLVIVIAWVGYRLRRRD